ncbi:CAP-Gly domain-containing linker protein 3-like isoform X2 [Pomacea canaliculata]|uniref:CAP-Gly domain-containing linker protein 3-like isoform X2 n=1 Tax=Pomacea canaliculata TaxID=400727 RepID=UPI000D730EB0|nr:CAP-Gly domain-containing linker protein 3-like isoform X2 [Pomacea canaliculata]XP_025109930.1 CAP-Gly domain-containing linker protein 3-like isoform X2 [Pomacea canaliculata]
MTSYEKHLIETTSVSLPPCETREATLLIDRMTLEEGNLEFKTTPVQSPGKPMIHPCMDPPLCENCQRLDLSFFDPMCAGCKEILLNPATTVPEIFAILRQWTPQTQQNLELLVDEILKRGANVNDRDGLTDMTLLHYASKAGAAGIGDPDLAAQVVISLLNKGADVNIRCRWTNMTALHYAAYFDVVPVLKVLLKTTKALDIDSTCSEFEHGTALHIAASNLAHEAIKVLLQNGANPGLRDDLGRLPIDCVPEASNNEVDSDKGLLIQKVRKTLQEATPSSPNKPPPNYDLVHSKVTLQALGLQLGDKIVVSGIKTGYLRYCGPTEFASGVWAGIELDEPLGKNDGSIGGISYFKCPPNYGIFAPISKVTKPGALPVSKTPPPSPMRAMSKGHVDVSRVTARVDTGLVKPRGPSVSETGDNEVGDRVIVAGQRKGTIRYMGETQFAPGFWFGIELDRPVGKNDGSVKGVRYFTCKEKHGVFAPLSRIQKLRGRLGDRRFSSDESLETISWGAVSERLDRKVQGFGRSKTPTKSPKIGIGITRTPGATQNFTLEVGMSVLCNNELGTIRYIGPTEFGEGTWLGVELRSPKGKNDGSVQGKRYFTCKPDHGLLVKPSKVTVRGINGAKLLGENPSSPVEISTNDRHNRSSGERDVENNRDNKNER